ncbi:MAG: 2-phosphosulfolactate phosphatase [Anaerolineales bacterium]
MEIDYVGLEGAAEIRGVAVVIDVLRAFTTAAFAFAAGAEALIAVSTVEEALALQERHPDYLLMGEERGLPIEAFDFDNSPASFAGVDLSGHRLVQRTSSGTQGIVRSGRAATVLGASLVCAQATVDYLRALSPEQVTMVITGSHAGGLRDEDLAGADYLSALLRGEKPPVEEVVERVRASRAAEKFRDPTRPEFRPRDLDYAVDIDRFDFAMVVERRQGQQVLVPADAGGR